MRHRFRGFSLIETLVAIVILGIGLAGLTALMVGNMATGREGRRLTAAGALAQQKLEDLRATGYATATGSASAEALTETGATSGATIYTRTWTVANGPTPGTRTLTVSVAWADDQGGHHVQLQSRISP